MKEEDKKIEVRELRKGHYIPRARRCLYLIEIHTFAMTFSCTCGTTSSYLIVTRNLEHADTNDSRKLLCGLHDHGSQASCVT